MRQAIEEGFILDVLQNYTTYKLAFKLAHDGKECDEKEVERSAAMKGIMGWVRLHPYNIAQGRARDPQALRGTERQEHCPSCSGRTQCVAALSVRHSGISETLHIPVANLRLRQHRDREAFDLLQAGPAAAGIRT